jgi:hypothetical protein
LNRDNITAKSEEIWFSKLGSDVLPEIKLAETTSDAEAARSEGFMSVAKSRVPVLQVPAKALEKIDREIKASALLRILAAYGILENRPYQEQESLLQDILQIFFETPEK